MKIHPIEINDEQTVLKLRSLGGGVEENGKIILHPLEAAFFAQLRVIDGNKKTFLKAAGKNAEKRYAVLANLRENGYIAKPSFDSDLLRVYRKGFRPGEDRTFCIVKVVDSEISRSDLVDFVEFAGKLRKEAVLAYVGKEIIFIKVSKTSFL